MPKGDPEAAARAAEAAWEAIQAGAWPFQDLCDSLCADLVSLRWEARHGAAMALREVLRSHACSAAVQAPLSAEPSGAASHSDPWRETLNLDLSGSHRSLLYHVSSPRAIRCSYL